MRLKDKDFQPPMTGLPAAYREWWDLGEGYEIYVSISGDYCTIGVHLFKKSITYEVAHYLNIDTDLKNIKFGGKPEGRELYLASGIDCIILIYMKPEKVLSNAK
jgi:hypothetical protein